ncbi:hypothetical protein XELAEV_18019046mg [Xenopus laevis]|nr:hypothetical protein XELAEV_18019046mg [Xenopus laevis]
MCAGANESARQCLRKRSRCWKGHVYASMAWPSSFLFLVLSLAAAVAVQPQDTELTFLLPAGRQECFYQSTLYNGSMEIEYQVIGGAGLDVDFSVTTPSGILLIMERRRSDGVHTVEPTDAGDYMICFDNSFSTISEKLVFFELIFDNQQGDEDPDSWADVVEPDELLDIKLEDIKESIESVKSRLERSIQMQTVLRAFEARDRNLQDSNLERVNFWSAINVGVLVTVAFLQVYMLKSLFDDKRKIRT